ncbi:DExH-box ATP-dependent RNA helicase DExH7, chloroplastic isoform X1 [Selaginella moellendorffii]|uniref:DExH-box ATP-dependent RNA helicase DExH7, chloroplastic isoform X1 n=1 Tax=Selaginella moellendorffii TaxID=88036 RepID=UPI000D1C2888|nr:DExH-box ATP-dependent RNA helicase DExH7, chloroplastic isoform X1 [Selaginella moellendorffii]|eukprot:XP_024539805.1 DExH-box ATP-dependent RNA helicase DExH7, chloroplastic isoform X1 [Selaginella moellendorffii]
MPMAPKQRGVALVRLSAEEEKALSRIVGNVASKSSSSGGEIVDKKQAVKKLRKIYDSLGNEGFTAEQIELALAAIPLSNVTLETALDWLCLNIHPNELPLKFSTGFSVDDKGGSIQVLASSQGDSSKSSESIREKSDFTDLLQLNAKEKRKTSENDADKDWIRQYVAQQEEEKEDDSQSDLSDWEERVDGKFSRHRNDPLDSAEKIALAFVSAKQAASEAKARGDKQRQSEAGKTIRDLKEKMLSLGLNEDDLVSSVEARTASSDQPIEDEVTSVGQPSEDQAAASVQPSEDQVAPIATIDQESSLVDAGRDSENKQQLTEHSDDKAVEDEENLGGMFDEESAQAVSIPQTLLKLQKKEEIKPWGMKDSRGDKSKRKKAVNEPQKFPRAILQQYCQKNGWEAPKFEKLAAQQGAYNYAITVFRPRVGRGKQKKGGGPVTFSFPDADLFSTVSEAQDAVATWSLFSLFPEAPIYLELVEPFRSMWLRWHEQGKMATEGSTETRDDFISSLLESERPRVSPDEAVRTPESTSKPFQPPVIVRERKSFRQTNHDAVSSHLKLIQERKLKDKKYQAMLSARHSLPIASVKETILQHLVTSNVLVVSGETGSGKTTQVPQYILDDMIAAGHGSSCKIICTQPRRIAAISVSERVASERCEAGPGEAGSTVGYQVRLDASWTDDTRLFFCTTGILLRRLASDPDLCDVSHVVVDEVHERTVLGDFLISLLRDLVAKRNEDKMNPLKVILMSATLDADRFSQYFGGCPVVVATGRTYPVQTFYLEDIYEQLEYRLSSDNPAALQNYSSHDKRASQNVVDKNRGRQDLARMGWGDDQILESRPVNPLYEESLYRKYSENTRKNLANVNEDVIDYELLEDLIMHINETGDPGALLVFLPGMPEILQLLDRLMVLKTFSGPAAEWLLPLHSSVAPADQRKVFQVPPRGIRKIVLATNIAETSVTIEDVVHVIDCGKHKENRFEPRRRMSRMMEAWISQANARQRRGRAGRVKAGNCYCFYTESRFDKLMRPFQLPEMLRVPLVELCLQIKLLSVENVASFLEKALDPPKTEAVESALSILREVGALTEEEYLTPLGSHLAALPVDVHIGKMLLYGALLGCLSPVLTIAAYLSHKSPFVAPLGQRDAAERAKHAFGDSAAEKSTIASGRQSDHLVIVAAYENWRRLVTQGGARAARQFCDASFLSMPVLNMLREMRLQFAKLLKDIGFISKVPAFQVSYHCNSFSQGDNRAADIDKCLDEINQPFNQNAQSASVIKAVLCAGLYPNVATMMEESVKAGHANALNQRAGLASEKNPRWTDGRREVYVHPSSINSKVKEFQHPFLVFHEKVETSRVYLRDTTVLSPFALLLFGGSIKVQHQVGYATVDDWMKIDVPARTAVLFKELRSSLDLLLSELTKSPQGLSSARGKEVVNSVLKLLVLVEQ